MDREVFLCFFYERRGHGDRYHVPTKTMYYLIVLGHGPVPCPSQEEINMEENEISMPTKYDPQSIEKGRYQWWLDGKFFEAT